MITFKILKNEKQMLKEKDFIIKVSKIYNTKPEYLCYLTYFLENFYKTHKNNFIVIAKENDNILSVVRFEYKYSIDNLDMKNKVLITGLATLEDFRNRGIASKVLQKGIGKVLKDTPSFQICLGVNKDNVNAINLYKKLGFIIEENEQDIDLPYFNKNFQIFMHYEKQGN